MPQTYTPIASTTLTAAQSTVTFSSIPSTYTDLVLVATGTESANQYMGVRLNSDTATNYSQTQVRGEGTSATSARTSGETFGRILIGDPTNQFTSITSFQNYSNTTTYKTWLTRSNTANNYVGAIVGLWRATPAAISSIQILTTTADTFAIGSTFTLYGILKA